MSLYVKESSEVYDVIIVGSGITGGWAAKEFCERGFKTLMIERGRVVEHRKDYTGEGKPLWDMPTRGEVENLLANQQHSVQKECYAFNDATKHFFGNDRDLPYSTEPGTQWTWIRGNQLGGKSLTWARQSYRLSEFDFEANTLDGHGNDWPIRYQDLAPWYSHVENHAGISGASDNLPQLPDGDFLPPFEMTSPEKFVKSKIENQFPDRNIIIGRTANLSQPRPHHFEQGRAPCMARDECQKGCSFGAPFSTQSSTLPAATKTGNLTIAPNSVVHSVIYDERTQRAAGVRVIDNEDLSEREYRGKIVFLCASTLGTTQVLLNSTSSHFPQGIANRSGVLGHYLMDHNFNASASGEIEGFEDEYYSGRRPTGILMPNFYFRPDKKRGFKRGYSFGGGSYRESWKSGQYKDGLGKDFKESLRHPGAWRFGLYAQGEMLPRFENSVSLHPSLKDKWGMPQLHVNCQFSKNETDMMEDAAAEGERMLKAIGLKHVTSEVYHGAPGLAIHETGTARMGRDPRTSVLNGFNQCHDVKNLFVTDGSSYCSSPPQNPSLTFMALTVRAVDFAAKEFKASRL